MRKSTVFILYLAVVLFCGCYVSRQTEGVNARYDVEAVNVNAGIKHKWENIRLDEIPYADLRYAISKDPELEKSLKHKENPNDRSYCDADNNCVLWSIEQSKHVANDIHLRPSGTEEIGKSTRTWNPDMIYLSDDTVYCDEKGGCVSGKIKRSDLLSKKEILKAVCRRFPDPVICGGVLK